MKKKTLTTTKLIRMTEAQKVKSKDPMFARVVRMIADTWGTRKGRVIVDMIEAGSK